MQESNNQPNSKSEKVEQEAKTDAHPDSVPPPADNVAMDNAGKSESSKNDAPGAAASKSPAGAAGLRFNQILKRNGNNLVKTIASLTERKKKRPVYIESTPEELSSAVNGLVEDNKGALRLRTILGYGLQQGAKRSQSDAFWCELLQVIEAFLRETEFPRAVSREIGDVTIEAKAYQNLWERVIAPDERSKMKSATALHAAQEVLILDVLFAYWKERVSAHAALEAISYLEQPDSIKDPLNRRLPWDPAVSMASGLPTPIIVAQAAAFHSELDHWKQAHTEAAQQIEQLQEKLKAKSAEANDTQSALEEETKLLNEANQTIRQLKLDVKASGAIHQHGAEELRSRYKGLFEGNIARHLETIQSAADMSPPRSSVIVERVETLLSTLQQELKWLKDSE